MSRNVKVWVELDRPSAKYWPGEMISGHLFVQTINSPQTISQLKLRLFGACKIRLERQVGRELRTYRKIETLVLKEQEVQDLTIVPNPETMTRGIHVFEFRMMLPPEIPPNFVGSHGFIIYSLEVRTSNPRLTSVLFILPIAVLAYLDLSRIREAQEMVRREMEFVNGGCFISKRHDIQVKAWLDRGGLLLGEKIPLHVEINNQSEVRIKYTKFKLYMTQIYHFTDERVETVSPVKNFRCMKGSEIAPSAHETLNLQEMGLELPAEMPVTGPPGCCLVDLSFELIVKVVPVGCVPTIRLRFPVIVGATMPDDVEAEVQKNLAARRATAAALLLAMLEDDARS